MLFDIRVGCNIFFSTNTFLEVVHLRQMAERDNEVGFVLPEGKTIAFLLNFRENAQDPARYTKGRDYLVLP